MQKYRRMLGITCGASALIGAVLFGAGCSSNSSFSNTGSSTNPGTVADQTANVTISIGNLPVQKTKLLPPTWDHILISVTAPEDPSYKRSARLSLANPTASLSVRTGADRDFYAVVYDNKDKALIAGETTKNILAGMPNTVAINLCGPIDPARPYDPSDPSSHPTLDSHEPGGVDSTGKVYGNDKIDAQMQYGTPILLDDLYTDENGYICNEMIDALDSTKVFTNAGPFIDGVDYFRFTVKRDTAYTVKLVGLDGNGTDFDHTAFGNLKMEVIKFLNGTETTINTTYQMTPDNSSGTWQWPTYSFVPRVEEDGVYYYIKISTTTPDIKVRYKVIVYHGGESGTGVILN
jgi:hypothetical protein